MPLHHRAAACAIPPASPPRQPYKSSALPRRPSRAPPRCTTSSSASGRPWGASPLPARLSPSTCPRPTRSRRTRVPCWSSWWRATTCRWLTGTPHDPLVTCRRGLLLLGVKAAIMPIVISARRGACFIFFSTCGCFVLRRCLRRSAACTAWNGHLQFTVHIYCCVSVPHPSLASQAESRHPHLRCSAPAGSSFWWLCGLRRPLAVWRRGARRWRSGSTPSTSCSRATRRQVRRRSRFCFKSGLHPIRLLSHWRLLWPCLHRWCNFLAD